MRYRNSKLVVGAAGITAVCLLPFAATGVANAASPSSMATIPITTIRQDRQEAVASVLGTTTQNLQSELQSKSTTFKQLITNAGLTPKTFGQDVRAKVISELEGQGYSQSEITLTLKQSHRHHERQLARLGTSILHDVRHWHR